MRIDAHSHLMPTALFDALPPGLDALPPGLDARPDEAGGEIALAVRGRAGKVGRGAVQALRELAVHRERQAAHDIDLTIVGPWVDMVAGPVDSVTQTALCRTINEALAAAVGDVRHTRFVAALPDIDGGAAADVLEEALAVGAVGGMLSTSPAQGSLARPDFDALWRTAEARGAPLLLHPGEFTPPPRLREYFMVNLVGNPTETTLAAGSLLGADVPGRFADLRLLLVHGGGFFPYQAARMDVGFRRWPGLAGRTGRPPLDYLRWFSYDTVLFDDGATRFLLDRVGEDRVLAGTDSPFALSDYRPFDAPESLGLDTAQTAQVLGGNAARFYGLTPDTAPPTTTTTRATRQEISWTSTQ